MPILPDYSMDSETAIDRGYGDLSLILRPDMRKYKLLDHLLEFKQLPWKALGSDGEAALGMRREELRELPPVAEQLTITEAQLARYRETLEGVYGEKLRQTPHPCGDLYRTGTVGGERRTLHVTGHALVLLVDCAKVRRISNSATSTSMRPRLLLQ
ncbi:MAG: hypothetical protein LGR52_00720 [Candidatus Thiosymbion ectosymbiont of Robbea hypermnestra]|nr:hypothetical protein [Candidatus Thiosymbion ectosymbiont of Robbea hypermnestra]